MDYVQIKDFGGTSRKVGAVLTDTDKYVQISAPFQANRSDTFTGTGNGTTVNTSDIPVSRFGLQVKGTGAVPTSWQVVLEGSLNSTDFSTILTHQNGINTDGAVVSTGTSAPFRYFRSRVVALTLGSATNIVVHIIGEAA